MTDKELIGAIKQLKNFSAAGNPSEEFVKRNREILMMQVKNSTTEMRPQFSIGYAKRLFESVLPHGFYKFAVKPLVTAVVTLAVAAGSWAATFSASYESLPGDTLYGVKLAAEKTQLTLTPSSGKASLNVEFANRRLEEIAKIAGTSSINNKDQRTKRAVENFKFHITAVKDSLGVLQKGGEGGEKAVEMAEMVDRKTQEYGATLQKMKEDASSDMKKEVEMAANLIDDASIQAVGVMVKNLSSASSSLAASVSDRVEDKIKKVETKVAAIDTNTSSTEEAAKEAKAALDEAKTALENNDLTAAVDKLVEVKNLVNSVTGN